MPFKSFRYLSVFQTITHKKHTYDLNIHSESLMLQCTYTNTGIILCRQNENAKNTRRKQNVDCCNYCICCTS